MTICFTLPHAMLALLMAACASGAAEHERVCAARGLTPGTDSFARCVELEEWNEQQEFRRIRDAREMMRADGP
jgi:hypothetical protein